MELGNLCSFHRKFLTSDLVQKFGVLILTFCYLLDSCVCYNLDLETATIHSGESRSKFGYAVALHQDQGAKWLLIGAPRAQTRQPGVTRGGAVYRCPIDSGYCQEIPFDTKGNDIRHNGTHYRDVEDKSDQWFGAALKSSLNGIIVACAPRYVYFSTRLDKREPVGTCFVARSSSADYEEYSPCRSSTFELAHVKRVLITKVNREGSGVDGLPLITDQFHQQGYCQAGFSASLTSDTGDIIVKVTVKQDSVSLSQKMSWTILKEEGRQLLVGAVGSWYWQGQLFNFNFEDGPGRYEATPEGRKDKDYSYMGYASAVGYFDEDSMEDYVVGVPRGRNLQGLIMIYTQNLTSIDSIRGEQFGSYFGYSVEVQDLDKNGYDDIIVGAPFFSNFGTDNMYETGRVYIFYQNSRRRFSKRNKDILDGHHSRSRFGQALCALGDIDLDGYNDIAVGAPYGGDDGRGAVYIYHGSMRGIITDVQQVIKAEEVLQGIETFGWSLSGSLDMDLNQYPDLLIGAQESNKALFLRSRPVVRVTPSISIKPDNITLEEDPKFCNLRDGTQVLCVNGYACISYTGVGVPDTLDFKLTWKLDALKNDSSRVFFLHAEDTRELSLTETYYKDTMKCETALGYLINDVRDKIMPIVIDFKFDLVEKRSSRRRREVLPILNQRSRTSVSAEANITKRCGEDKRCDPDLAVTAVPVSDNHILGQKVQRGKTEGMLQLLVFVENRGEESYESMLNITLPPGVSFFRITDRKYEIPMSFTPPEEGIASIIFDLGNPLPPKSRTNFTLWVNPKAVTGTVSELVFTFEATSSNLTNDTNLNNNVAIAKIPIKQRADLTIGGIGAPEQIIYSDSDVKRYRSTLEVGPPLKHRYIVSNRGPTAVQTSIIKISWPSYDSRGLNLLQIEGDPEVSRPDVSCIFYNHNFTQITEYSTDGSGIPSVILSQKAAKSEETARTKRDIVKRSRTDFKNVGCEDGVPGCTYIHCTVGHLKPDDSVEITLRARVWTSTLIQKKIQEPFYFISSAAAEVLSMPYSKLDVTPGTLLRHIAEIGTYVNPEKLFPKRKGIEPWIIGVAVSAGLLLLFLLIMLLWWCGFFRRKRPEEKAYLTPRNGEYKQVAGASPDEKYRYM